MASEGRFFISSRAKPVTYVAEGTQRKKCNLLGGKTKPNPNNKTNSNGKQRQALSERKVLENRTQKIGS